MTDEIAALGCLVEMEGPARLEVGACVCVLVVVGGACEARR